MAHALRVVEVTDLAQFCSYKHHVEALVRTGCRAKSLFFTHQYLETWLETFGGESSIHILLTFHGEVLTAICPLLRDRVFRVGGVRLSTYKNIGEGLWGYCGVLVHPDYLEQTCAFLVRYLPKRFPRARVTLSSMAGDAPAAIRLATVAPGRVKVEVFEDAPYIDTSCGFDEYAKSLATKKAAIADARRCQRRLSELGTLSFNILPNSLTKEELNRHLDVFLELYYAQWETNRFRRDPRYHSFYRDFGFKALRDGIAHFSYLSLDDAVLAFHYGFKLNGTLYYVTPTYDVRYGKYSPGKVLLYELIKLSFSEQLQFDFMNALEPYKLDWAGSRRKRVYISLYSSPAVKSLEACYGRVVDWFSALDKALG